MSDTTSNTTNKPSAKELALMDAEQIEQPGSTPWRAILAVAAGTPEDYHQLTDKARSGVGVLARRGLVSKSANRYQVTPAGVAFYESLMR